MEAYCFYRQFYRQALTVFTRGDALLDWAMTQTNLATAPQALAAHRDATAHLQEAVAASQAALELFVGEGAKDDVQVVCDHLDQAEQLLREKSP